MSETPAGPLTDTDRNRLFDTWLKPIQPAKPRLETVVEKLAPWRRQFADAVAAGYTWRQLAEEVAAKPEIGIKISAEHLRKSIFTAFQAAGETTPGQIKAKRRNRRQRVNPSTVTPTAIAIRTN
jgi:hypothetical protein